MNGPRQPARATPRPAARRRWSLPLLAIPLLVAGAESPFQPKLPDDSLWAQGRHVYQRHCLICHGADGRGGGEMSRDLQPRPRDFRRGIFKYHSTPAGKLPTNEDLERTIRGGVPGTAMPMFTTLADREVRAVMEYLKGFSPRWQQRSHYAPPVELPVPPAWFQDAARRRARAAEGHRLFASACAACHGPDGDGQGAAARHLEDVWGHPNPPASLRQSVLRSAGTWPEVHRVLLTGIDGTAMPSFAESLTESQRWDILALLSAWRDGAKP